MKDKDKVKDKFMESSMGEKSAKVDELSQAQDVLDRKVIHHEKKNSFTFVREENSYTMNHLSPQQFHEEQRKMREKERVENEIRKKSIREDKRIEEQDVIEEKSREEKVKSIVSTKESEGKRKESECLIENHESLEEEQVEEKKDEIEKSEETKVESKIHILLESFVESGYDEIVIWISWSLCDVFYAKLKGKFIENCDYASSSLYTSMKDFDGFIPSIQLLCFVSDQFEFPHDEQKVLTVDEFLKALLLENNHGFQFYHFHFKEFMWLLFCEKKMNGYFKVLKIHLCNLVKTTFENGVFELTLKNLVEKLLVYPISFIDFLFKDDMLNDLLVQNTISCVKLLNQIFGAFIEDHLLPRCNSLLEDSFYGCFGEFEEHNHKLQSRPTIDGRSRPTMHGRSWMVSSFGFEATKSPKLASLDSSICTLENREVLDPPKSSCCSSSTYQAKVLEHLLEQGYFTLVFLFDSLGFCSRDRPLH
ncbi:hypothetical protein M9H77_07276 [Catharanthus roseus]|uniref:Uncharacterized protein n=1 Tax=Catharanthus roseus TaxID=4058 RepID=A0ACC0BUL1_CATRO|nr:hypothetical protein M9H77_07276 [Catharanthus roseus]